MASLVINKITLCCINLDDVEWMCVVQLQFHIKILKSIFTQSHTGSSWRKGDDFRMSDFFFFLMPVTRSLQ